MKRYQPQSKMSAVAMAASLLATAATIGVAVVLPTQLEPASDATVLARQGKPAIEVALVPSRIEVIGFRSERSETDPTLGEAQPRARKS